MRGEGGEEELEQISQFFCPEINEGNGKDWGPTG